MIGLPPPGTRGDDLATLIDQLVQECEQNPLRAAFLAEAERGLNLYLGNHFETAERTDTIRIVLNRIQNAIVSLVAIQAADKPKPIFTPRETGEPPVYYLNTELPEGQMILAQLAGQQAEAIAMGEQPSAAVDPMLPLPDDVAKTIKAQIEAGQVVAAQAAADGLPPPPGLLPKELLIEVTDATTAQALQTVFESLWEQGDGHYVYSENIFHKFIGTGDRWSVFGNSEADFCWQTPEYMAHTRSRRAAFG